ncbi:hypothetical protein NYE46_09445 [Listeria sp. FSL L8-0308]|uniref:hypothetical protein n=1 Tax=Bacillales TaxID=1385 RepID=UPI001EE490CC|nr:MULTISPECIES: hypothetical protein [Paenibacillus]
MKLYIAGINHNDPVSRTGLIQWLHEIKAENQTKPDFIASEWDEEVYTKVAAQRPYLSQLLEKEWPDLNQKQIESISKTLAYEGDSHKGIFDNVNVLWLDDSRVVDQEAVDNFAKLRLQTLKMHCNNDAKFNFIEELSRNLKKNECSDLPTIERDIKFASTIFAYVEENRCEWGIIIVGSLHASEEEGTMRNQLEYKGYECLVKHF